MTFETFELETWDGKRVTGEMDNGSLRLTKITSPPGYENLLLVGLRGPDPSDLQSTVVYFHYCRIPVEYIQPPLDQIRVGCRLTTTLAHLGEATGPKHPDRIIVLGKVNYIGPPDYPA